MNWKETSSNWKSLSKILIEWKYELVLRRKWKWRNFLVNFEFIQYSRNNESNSSIESNEVLRHFRRSKRCMYYGRPKHHSMMFWCEFMKIKILIWLKNRLYGVEMPAKTRAMTCVSSLSDYVTAYTHMYLRFTLFGDSLKIK